MEPKSTPSGPARYLYVICQAGAEPALKKELAREHPELKFAFSRPGFVTFKQVTEEPAAPTWALRSVFARAYGWTRGRGPADPSEMLARAAELAAPACLQIFERDRYLPGSEPLGFVVGALARAATERVRQAAREAGMTIRLNEESRAQETVLDLIVVEENEWWWGEHVQTAAHSPFPGGRPRILMPADAPSRAYLKLEEGLRWSNAPLAAGDVAIEVGSAPGGASYALLKRGLKVVGIDPGQMAEVVLGDRNFLHLQKKVADVKREELPEGVSWIFLDMNVLPAISLYAVDRLAAMYGENLKGLLLTVKLNEWKIADELPGMLEHVRSMGSGMVRARATQLPSNRQEIFICGLTRLGASPRLKKSFPS